MNDVTKPRPKCLFVDDLKENILALQSLLAEEDMEVIAAYSGREALELLLRHDFAVALVDVQMPEMDGFELAELMRATTRTRAIPIIFVTAAGADAERIFKGYEAGAVDFLQKPLNPQIVLSKVRVFLMLYQQKLQLQQKVERLRQAEASLQKALQSRDEFLSICSHELKTPLTSLKMQIQMNERLREKKGDEVAFAIPTMVKFMQQADRSLDRIIHLVNDMLDISRVATGRLSLNLEELDLGRLVTEVAERMAPLLEMASVTLRFDLQENLKVRGDRFRLEQVLTNLLMNVAKYAPDGPVDVSLSSQESMVRLVVKDYGKGISVADQSRIFERFERAVSHMEASGLGLGLFISKEIVEMHHGEITVESVPGEGATFIVQLPSA